MSMNALHCIGVVTDDYEKARIKLESIKNSRNDVMYYSFNKSNMFIRFRDLTYRWVKPSENTMGVRLHGAYLDKDILIEVLENKIFPMWCSGYCNWYEYF